MYADGKSAIATVGGQPAFKSAATLQELLGETGEFFAGHRIDHAVLLSVPSTRSSIVLPLLEMSGELRTVVARSIRLNKHPIAGMCQEVMRFPTLSELCRSAGPSPEVEELAAAYRRAGFARAYMLPLGCGSAQTAGEAELVLEVARKNAPIARVDLAEIQVKVQHLPDKVAPLIDAMAHVLSYFGCDDDRVAPAKHAV